MKRIKRFGVIQTAKLVGAVYFFVSAVMLIPIALIAMATGNKMMGLPLEGILVVLLPIMYGILGFIGAALFCIIYNFVASKIGGIELELE